MADEPEACDHHYVYAGMRYAVGANKLAGSGARRVYYAHVYFCKRCTSRVGEPVDAGDTSTYEPIRFNATPGSHEDVGVPRYDRTYGGI